MENIIKLLRIAIPIVEHNIDYFFCVMMDRIMASTIQASFLFGSSYLQG